MRKENDFERRSNLVKLSEEKKWKKSSYGKKSDENFCDGQNKAL